jgi:hypothetical protein
MDLITGSGIGNLFGFIADHLHNRVFQTFAGQGFPALPVNHLPLLVHDIIILDQLFAYVEIVSFNLGLGVFNGPADHVVFDGLSLLHAQFLHDAGDAFAAEYAQKIIFKGQIKSRRTGIPLPAGPTAQLIVDAAAFMPFGAENVKSA